MSEKHLNEAHAAAHDTPPEGVEPDRPPVLGVYILFVVMGVFLLGTLVFSAVTVDLKATSLIRSKQFIPNNAQISTLQAEWKGKRENYAQIDAQAGVYAIPVKQAMEAVIQRPTLLKPIPAGAPQSFHAPAAP